MSETMIAQVRAVLATTAERWEALTETLPADLLNRPAAPGEWSARQCLEHLLDTERQVFPVRLRAFLAGQDFPGFNPDSESSDYRDKVPAELAAEFVRLRVENLTLLDHLTPQDLLRTARHAELGQVTLEQMLYKWAAHDFNHTIQAERALMQPFITGSGPWRFYFKDHDISA
jgi:hypothetical protein